MVFCIELGVSRKNIGRSIMNFITNFLILQNQLKVYHWQTQYSVGSHAAHLAFGQAYDELGELIDTFIEVYQGKKGLIKAKNGFMIKLHNLDEDYEKFIDVFVNFLIKNVTETLDPTLDTDLLNIRDEMLGVLNQTKYRLHMK